MRKLILFAVAMMLAVGSYAVGLESAEITIIVDEYAVLDLCPATATIHLNDDNGWSNTVDFTYCAKANYMYHLVWTCTDSDADVVVTGVPTTDATPVTGNTSSTFTAQADIVGDWWDVPAGSSRTCTITVDMAHD